MEPPEDQHFEMVITESLHETLAKSAKPHAVWLWCIFCERFFQARYLRIDFQDNREGCAFCDCAGFDCAIFKWDTFRESGDPYWPTSESDLRHGLRLGAETAPPTLH